MIRNTLRNVFTVNRPRFGLPHFFSRHYLSSSISVYLHMINLTDRARGFLKWRPPLLICSSPSPVFRPTTNSVRVRVIIKYHCRGADNNNNYQRQSSVLLLVLLYRFIQFGLGLVFIPKGHVYCERPNYYRQKRSARPIEIIIRRRERHRFGFAIFARTDLVFLGGICRVDRILSNECIFFFFFDFVLYIFFSNFNLFPRLPRHRAGYEIQP